MAGALQLAVLSAVHEDRRFSRPPKPGPAPGWAYAGFWVRTAAALIDLVILIVVIAVLAILLGVSEVARGGSLETTAVVGSSLATLVPLGYFVTFWVARSQTPGMAAFNLRVLRAADGGPVYVGRAVLRLAVLFVSAVLLLGVVWVAFDRAKQGWHDRAAGTLVVRPQ